MRSVLPFYYTLHHCCILTCNRHLSCEKPCLFIRQWQWDCHTVQATKRIVSCLDFKLSPCSLCSMFSFGYFPGVWGSKADVSEPSIGSILCGSGNGIVTQYKLLNVSYHVSILSFRRVLYVVCFLLGISPASEVQKPTFRNPLSVPSCVAVAMGLSHSTSY